MRLASGDEALITRAVAPDGKVGYGYSLTLDATEARHMAQRNAHDASSMATLPGEIQAAIGSLSWLPA
jgi:hypothetical protein